MIKCVEAFQQMLPKLRPIEKDSRNLRRWPEREAELKKATAPSAHRRQLRSTVAIADSIGGNALAAQEAGVQARRLA